MSSSITGERRASPLQSMSLLIDLGVTYARTLGEPAARALFAEHAIPPDIVERALAGPTQRRLTQWERCPFEVAVRQVLSARPLLNTVAV
jgi:hypothetical protein